MSNPNSQRKFPHYSLEFTKGCLFGLRLLPQLALKNLLDEKVTVRNILCPICACYYRYDFAEAFPEVICEFFEQDV